MGKKKKYQKLFVFPYMKMLPENIEIPNLIDNDCQDTLFVPWFDERYGEEIENILDYSDIICLFLGGYWVDNKKTWKKISKIWKYKNEEMLWDKNLKHEYLFIGKSELEEIYNQEKTWVDTYLNKLGYHSNREKEKFFGFEFNLEKIQVEEYNETLKNLLLRYFGEDDVMIPYDLEDRKKKFPLAFKELGDYMKG